MHVPGALDDVFVTRRRPPVAHRDALADREVAGSRLQHVVRAPVGGLEVLVHGRVRAEVAAPGRELAHDVAQHRHDVRLVDRARDPDEVAEVLDRVFAERTEPIDDLGLFPAALDREPARRREVMKRHHGHDARLVARGEHPAVVVERSTRHLAVLRFDTRPLDGEAIGAEPEVAHERDVVAVPVIAVAAVSRHFCARRTRCVLERPPVVVPVAALDLMRRGRGAPEEAIGESHSHGRGGYRP